MSSISSFAIVGFSGTLEVAAAECSLCVACVEILVMSGSASPWKRSPLSRFPCRLASAWEISMAFTMHALRRKKYSRKKSTTRKMTKKTPHNTRKNIDVLDAIKEKYGKLDKSCACSTCDFVTLWHPGKRYLTLVFTSFCFFSFCASKAILSPLFSPAIGSKGKVRKLMKMSKTRSLPAFPLWTLYQPRPQGLLGVQNGGLDEAWRLF